MHYGWMVLLTAAGLAGCGPAAPLAEVGIGVVSGASIPISYPISLAVPAATGRNCFMVGPGGGEAYCRTWEPKPLAPKFCTRSLGMVDCWEDPEELNDHPRGVADGPQVLTPEQEKDRAKPGLGTR